MYTYTYVQWFRYLAIQVNFGCTNVIYRNEVSLVKRANRSEWANIKNARASASPRSANLFLLARIWRGVYCIWCFHAIWDVELAGWRLAKLLDPWYWPKWLYILQSGKITIRQGYQLGNITIRQDSQRLALMCFPMTRIRARLGKSFGSRSGRTPVSDAVLLEWTHALKGICRNTAVHVQGFQVGIRTNCAFDDAIHRYTILHIDC